MDTKNMKIYLASKSHRRHQIIKALDHPIEIEEGMVFALETQHGKPLEWGCRIEEMVIVHKDETELITHFPIDRIMPVKVL